MQINGTVIETGQATAYNEGLSAVIRHIRLIVLHRKGEAFKYLVSPVDEFGIPFAWMMKMRVIQHNGELFAGGMHA